MVQIEFVYRRQGKSICVDLDVLTDLVILKCKLAWIYRPILFDNSIEVVSLNNVFLLRHQILCSKCYLSSYIKYLTPKSSVPIFVAPKI